MVRRWVLAGSVLLVGSAAEAQVPAGFEVVVNTATGFAGNDPTVEMDAAGQFVVGWSRYYGQDANRGAFIRRYAADGTPLADRFALSAATLYESQVSVGANAKGDFVVTWGDEGQGKVRLFDAAGQPRGNEITLAGGEVVGHTSVTTAADGGFVVAWSDLGYPMEAVTRHRYDRNGQSLGGDFQVNAFSTSQATGVVVAGAPDGRSVVAWETGFSPARSIHARRLDAAGTPLGSEFRASTDTADDQVWGWDRGLDHTMAMAPDGSFVVTWTQGDPQNFQPSVFAQRFDALGQPVGSDFRVSNPDATYAYSSRVASDAGGNFVVVWSQLVGSFALDVLGRRYDANGAPRGAEFRVNRDNRLIGFGPNLDVDPVGNFVVTWDTLEFVAGGGSSTHARRFGGLLPAAMTVDASGNGVLEPGEAATVAPSWRNVNGVPQTFGGTLTGLTGPAGGTYTITDGAADYGTLANGASGSCGANCYGLSVSGTRPATHWDAVATERLAPDAQGQVAAWPLHVGDSFSDVPRSSAFYRFVETLLHRGVTGGCGPATYCPTASTTREQIAVFALVSKEGALYAPPACATPLFADVPASSPFCKWIEELARRGVVGGCGGGNFCPTAVVSRDQMAVIVLRTLDPALSPPACTTPRFADVPASSPFCKWIEELARRGVVGGCGGDNYCPTAVVTREQMSVFLGATFGLTLYGP